LTLKAGYFDTAKKFVDQARKSAVGVAFSKEIIAGHYWWIAGVASEKKRFVFAGRTILTALQVVPSLVVRRMSTLISKRLKLRTT
jgi:hypothetical protein